MNLAKPTSILCIENPVLTQPESCLHFESKSVTIKKSNKKYSLNHVLKDTPALDDFNKEFKDKLLNTVLDGYNASLIFLGKQSKTTTPYPCDKIGNMIAYQLFDKLKKLSFGKRSYMVTISTTQIKESELTDLLNPKDGRSMTITENGSVDGVTRFVMDSEFNLLTFLGQAWQAHHELKKSSKCICVVQIDVYQKIEGKNIGIKSSLQLIDLSNLDDNSITTLSKNAMEKKKNSDSLSKVIESIVGGNTVLYVFAALDESNSEESVNRNQSILDNVELLNNVKNHPVINLDESDYLVKELREQVHQMQEKLADKKPNNLDVQRFEKLLEDLEIHKRRCWPAIQRGSKMAELERRTNLANKGLAKIFASSKDNSSVENQKLIDGLEKKLTEAKKKFEKQSELVDRLKANLKLKIHESKGMKDSQHLTTEIQKENQIFNKEKDSLRSLQLEYQQIKKDYDRACDNQASLGLQSMERFENRWKFEQERLKMIEEEHQQSLEEERAHLEHMSQVRLPDPLPGSEVAKLKLDCDTALIENVLLKKENCELKDTLNVLFSGYKSEFQKLNAASFETFREYREYFEVHKHEIDIRYRHLLKDAVTDAIFLSSRNDELTMEVKTLQEECDRLRDESIQ